MFYTCFAITLSPSSSSFRDRFISLVRKFIRWHSWKATITYGVLSSTLPIISIMLNSSGNFSNVSSTICFTLNTTVFFFFWIIIYVSLKSNCILDNSVTFVDNKLSFVCVQLFYLGTIVIVINIYPVTHFVFSGDVRATNSARLSGLHFENCAE